MHARGDVVRQLGDDALLGRQLACLFPQLLLVESDQVVDCPVLGGEVTRLAFEELADLLGLCGEDSVSSRHTKTRLALELILLGSNQSIYSLRKDSLGLFDAQDFVSRHYSQAAQEVRPLHRYPLSSFRELIQIFNNLANSLHKSLASNESTICASCRMTTSS